MFDQVLGKKGSSAAGVGLGTLVSVVVHLALLAVAIWFSTRPPSIDDEETEVTFFAAAPPPPPPPPPPAASTPKVEKKTKKKPVKKPDTVVTAKDPTPEPEKPPEPVPEEPAPEEDPEEPEPGAQEGGVIGGVAGGVVGGVIGGVEGGQLGGQLGGEVMSFGEGMTRPERLSGRNPEYSQAALQAQIEGVMIVQCTITVEGEVTNCHIIKPLPHMERAVMEALRTWRMKPVMFQGRPVAVKYKIPIRLKIPD